MPSYCQVKSCNKTLKHSSKIYCIEYCFLIHLPALIQPNLGGLAVRISIFALMLSLVLLITGGQPAFGSSVRVSTDKLVQVLLGADLLYGSMISGLVSKSHKADRDARIGKLMELRDLIDETNNTEMREFFIESWEEAVTLDVAIDVSDVTILYASTMYGRSGDKSKFVEQIRQFLKDQPHVLLLERLLQGDISKEEYRQEFEALEQRVEDISSSEET